MLSEIELNRLTDLNSDLLEINLGIWKILQNYAQRFAIEIPYDPKLSYRIRQALELVHEINDPSPEMKRSHFSPEDETEPTDRWYLKGPSSIFHTGAG